MYQLTLVILFDLISIAAFFPSSSSSPVNSHFFKLIRTEYVYTSCVNIYPATKKNQYHIQAGWIILCKVRFFYLSLKHEPSRAPKVIAIHKNSRSLYFFLQSLEILLSGVTHMLGEVLMFFFSSYIERRHLVDYLYPVIFVAFPRLSICYWPIRR